MDFDYSIFSVFLQKKYFQCFKIDNFIHGQYFFSVGKPVNEEGNIARDTPIFQASSFGDRNAPKITDSFVLIDSADHYQACSKMTGSPNWVILDLQKTYTVSKVCLLSPIGTQIHIKTFTISCKILFFLFFLF